MTFLYSMVGCTEVHSVHSNLIVGQAQLSHGHAQKTRDECEKSDAMWQERMEAERIAAMKVRLTMSVTSMST